MLPSARERSLRTLSATLVSSYPAGRLTGATHMRVGLVVGAGSVEVRGRHVAVSRIRDQPVVAGTRLPLGGVAKMRHRGKHHGHGGSIQVVGVGVSSSYG